MKEKTHDFYGEVKRCLAGEELLAVLEDALEVLPVSVHDQEPVLVALEDVAAAAPEHGHAQVRQLALLPEGLDVVGLGGPDVEVHLYEERPVLVGLDLDGEGGVVAHGAADVVAAAVDLAEAANA